jgi:hypothetical protein
MTPRLICPKCGRSYWPHRRPGPEQVCASCRVPVVPVGGLGDHPVRRHLNGLAQREVDPRYRPPEPHLTYPDADRGTASKL